SPIFHSYHHYHVPTAPSVFSSSTPPTSSQRNAGGRKKKETPPFHKEQNQTLRNVPLHALDPLGLRLVHKRHVGPQPAHVAHGGHARRVVVLERRALEPLP